MSFPVPEQWTLGSADWARDEAKREKSPASFFAAQGRSLELAAGYFKDDRLQEKARGGVARKHRHRINLALFGQMMAAFEYMLKDFLATAIDVTDVLDARLIKADWIDIDVARVLAQRTAQTGVGAILVHPTLGWHRPDTVNDRYSRLFDYQPIADSEIPTLEQLWLVRHSVAHNAGWVTGHDAFRLGAGQLNGAVVNVDRAYLSESFSSLKPIAKRLAHGVGEKLVEAWVKKRAPDGENWGRDQGSYTRIKLLASWVSSRTKSLPDIEDDVYAADWEAYS